MPRTPKPGRGGSRQGTPGASYSNRSDLAVKTVPSQTYGDGAKQEASQKAVPLPNNAAAPAVQPDAQPVTAAGPDPGGLGHFTRPTERPLEPLSAGASFGAGPGPEILNNYGGDADTGAQLRALYAKYPNQDLADLIQVFDLNRVQ